MSLVKKLLFLIIPIVIIILVVGYLGFIPGLSDAMGTSKPRNLGVSYSQSDYASGLAKVPGMQVTNVSGVCLTCNYTSTGSIPVKTAFTQEEFTAQMNEENNANGPVKNTQFKFNADGTIEMSGLIVDPKLTGAVYVKGKIVSASGKSVVIKVDSAELGRLPLPDEQKKIAEDYVSQAVASYFSKNPGSNIISLKVSEGKLEFDGSLPASVVGEAK